MADDLGHLSPARVQPQHSSHDKMSQRMPSAATQLVVPETPLRSSGLFSSPERRTLVFSLALILLTVLVYWPVGNNAFINFDDNHYITENAHVRSGLSWNT